MIHLLWLRITETEVMLSLVSTWMGSRQETLGAVGSHTQQCSSSTELNREQNVLDVSYIPTYGTLSSQGLLSRYVSPGRPLKQTNKQTWNKISKTDS